MLKLVDAFGHLNGTGDGPDQSTGNSGGFADFSESGQFAGCVSDVVGATSYSSDVVGTSRNLGNLIGAAGHFGHFVGAPGHPSDLVAAAGDSSGVVGCSATLGLLHDAAVNVFGFAGKSGTLDFVQQLRCSSGFVGTTGGFGCCGSFIGISRGFGDRGGLIGVSGRFGDRGSFVGVTCGFGRVGRFISVTSRMFGTVSVTTDFIVVCQLIQTPLDSGLNSTGSLDCSVGDDGVSLKGVGRGVADVVGVSIRLGGVENILGILEVTAVVLSVTAFSVFGAVGTFRVFGSMSAFGVLGPVGAFGMFCAVGALRVLGSVRAFRVFGPVGA